MVEFFATHQGAINSRGKTAQTLKTQRRQHFLTFIIAFIPGVSPAIDAFL
jgi:hypothetical protein